MKVASINKDLRNVNGAVLWVLATNTTQHVQTVLHLDKVNVKSIHATIKRIKPIKLF